MHRRLSPIVRRLSSNASDGVKDDLRRLLRHTAQPVAVLTSFMSPDPSHTTPFHGATLSSFTSIALDPHALVAFSLRIPSRMAASLARAHRDDRALPSHMVVNILSAAQAHVAVRFARPDLHPHPFEADDVSYDLSEEGIPVLRGALGALSCRLVSASWPLHDLHSLSRSDAEKSPERWEGNGVASELYIAQVTRVENVGVIDDEKQKLPLLYHNRDYSTIRPLSPLHSPTTP